MTVLPSLILTRDLASLGLNTRQLPSAVKAGTLVRIRQGVYIDAAEWKALRPWDQYRVRIQAAAETCVSPTVFSHHSAACSWGIPTINRRQPIHALTTYRGGGRSRAGIRRHLVEDREMESEERDGLLVTSRAQTVTDIAAFVPFAEALVPLDHVLKPDSRLGLAALTKGDLLDAVTARFTPAAQRRVRLAIDFADPLSGSAGESYSRGLIRLAGFAAPVLQYEVRNSTGPVAWSDFYWEESRTVGEFDGFVKYGEAEYLKGRTPGRVVVDEKIREDNIRATRRHVVRWIWADLWRGGELERKLAEAGVPRRRRRSLGHVGHGNGAGTRKRPGDTR